MSSNPIIDAIMRRKSIRRYTSQQPTDEILHTIVKAGQQAPFAAQLGLKLARIGEVRYLQDLVVWASARKLKSVQANAVRPVRNAVALHLLGKEL